MSGRLDGEVAVMAVGSTAGLTGSVTDSRAAHTVTTGGVVTRADLVVDGVVRGSAGG